jgi:hypothetical protein
MNNLKKNIKELPAKIVLKKMKIMKMRTKMMKKSKNSKKM